MATTNEIYSLYLAYFGRPPDAVGFAAAQSKSVAQLQSEFSASAESSALLGSTNLATQVNNIYVNAFGRSAETAGLLYWVGEIGAARVTLSQAAFAIVSNALGDDRTVVTNKIAAATAFYSQVVASPDSIVGYSGNAASASARAFLAGVTKEAASVTAAVSGAAAAVISAVEAGQPLVVAFNSAKAAYDAAVAKAAGSLAAANTAAEAVTAANAAKTAADTKAAQTDAAALAAASTAAAAAAAQAVAAKTAADADVVAKTATLTAAIASGDATAVNVANAQKIISEAAAATAAGRVTTTAAAATAAAAAASGATADDAAAAAAATALSTAVAASRTASSTARTDAAAVVAAATALSNAAGATPGTADNQVASAAVTAATAANAAAAATGAPVAAIDAAAAAAAAAAADAAAVATYNTALATYNTAAADATSRLTAATAANAAYDTAAAAVNTLAGANAAITLAATSTAAASAAVAAAGAQSTAAAALRTAAAATSSTADDTVAATAVTASATATTAAGAAVTAAALDAAAAALVPATFAASTFTLTAGLNTFTGGSGADSFEGTTSTFQAFDNLSGGDGTDTVVVLQVAGAAANLEDGTFQNTKSVENVIYEATGKSANLGAIAQAAGVSSLVLGGTTGDANITGFASALSVTGNAGANTVTMTLADAGVKTLDLGSAGTNIDVVTVNGATNQVRLTFASGEVGNGSTTNATAAGAGQAYAGEAVGGVAVRMQQEDASGNLVAANIVHRVEDEGVRFTGATFDVRDLGTGAARGAFAEVQLGSSGADTVDLGGTAVAAYVNAGSGNDTITGSTKADFLVGGVGDDTINTKEGADSIIGGAGNDAVTVATTAVVSVDGGDGDDTITVTTGQTIVANTATAANNATIAGGAGTDRLVADTATLTKIDNTVASAVQSISGIETITVANQLGGALTLSKIQAGITGVTVNDSNTNAVTFDSGVAGTLTLAIAETGATINVASAGTGTTDALTIAGTKSINAFNGKAITATGVETLTIAGGTAGDATTQTLGNVTVTGTGTAVTTVNFTGNNVITAGVVEARSVDASGLTGGLIPAGKTAVTAATLSMTTATAVAKTTFSVIGSAQGDTITLGTGDVNVQAGAGNDVLVAGTALTSGDTLNGGDGTDTLALGAATTAENSAGVTGFEILRVDAALNQDMVQLQTNQGFTRIDYSVAGNVAVTNAAAATTEARFLTGSGTVSFDRLLDNTTNALTIGALTNVDTTVTALTVDDEETLTIGAGGITTAGTKFIVTTLNAADLVTLNITGAQNTKITNAIAGANGTLTTVNASAATGTVEVVASSSTVALTMTGSATAASSLTGGSGTDSITGGAAADNLNGGANADTINGGGGADTIIGGTGADNLTGGEGADTITGGAGNDTIVLTETTAAVDHVVFAASADNGTDSVTGFATGATGDVMNHFAATAVAGAAAAPTAVAAIGNLTAGADFVTAVLTADAAGTLTKGDVLRLIDIVDGQDITTAAGLQTALRNGGEYASVNGTNAEVSVIITASSAAAGTNYVFHVTGGSNAEVVTLVGTIANVQIGNFDAANFLV